MEDDIDVVEDEALRSFMPQGFGRQDRVANTAAQINQSKRNVDLGQRATRKQAQKSETEQSSDDDSDDEEESEEEEEFPVSHELLIKTHDRAVTTATLDPSGARLITGSMDCNLKFHDFASMTSTTIRAFKSVDPSYSKTAANNETHPIHQALYNPNSPGQVLVVAATPQPKILSRDGDILTTFVKGDMYLRDMHNTKGHISEITSAAWHPTNKNVCVTAGTDSTLRIWDVNNPRSQKDVIVHKSRAAGSAGRTRMTAVAWGAPAQGGNSILVAAAYDGSLAMWNGDGPYARPIADVRDAHGKDTWTSGIDISSDGRLVVTRGGDDTIKLWDTRKFKEPVNSVSHSSTSSQFPSTNIKFSPDSANVVTGSDTGHLHILNPATLRPELVTPVTPGSPLITVIWHEKLNQIITGSANAETHILYSPEMSNGGAKMIMLKAPKRRHIDDDPNLTTDTAQGMSGDTANTGVPPNSFAARHPTVGLTASGKPRDPRRPHIPQSTPFAKSQPDSERIKNSIPLSSMRDEDPREALFKYAEKAQKDPIFTNAWSKTQPKAVFADLSDEDEEPETKKAKR